MTAERPDACRVAAWMALLDAHSRLVGRLEADLERAHGLSLAEYGVLFRLQASPQGRVRLHELTEHARMSKSGVSRLVDRMEGTGLITTQRCPSDGRGAFAVLTDSGREMYESAAALHLRGVNDHFGRHLDDEEATALRRVLERLRDAVPRPGCAGLAAEAAPAVATTS